MRKTTKDWFVGNVGKLAVCSLLVALAVLPCPVWAQGPCFQDEDMTREDLIFCQSQEALLNYMEKSVSIISQGNEKAYKGFASWYVDDLLPGLDGAPPIEKVFRYLFEEVFLGGVTDFIPNKGVFIVGLLHGFSEDAYAGLAASVDGLDSRRSVLQALDLQLAKYKSSILALPAEFEAEYPDDFEGLMFQYLNEELETPQIHFASDYGVGSETKQMLYRLGFPEPSRETEEDIAERMLTSMVYEAKMKYNRKALEVLETEQIEIDARITARRILYPDQPDYYCQGAGMLGMLRPKDCYR